MKNLLVLVLALAACSKKPRPPHVFILNGLDIPVTVEIDMADDRTRVDVPPRGRVSPDVVGKATVKVTTAKGDLISESQEQFVKPTRSCYDVFNVMGAAAYVNEDVVYGTGFGTPGIHFRGGEITEHECGVSFAFEDPPEKVTVNAYGPAGDNRSWMHLVGDGGWQVAVDTLLADTGRWASQSRGAAQRIVQTVVTHDPTNPALPAIAERLRQLGLAMPAAMPGNLLAEPGRRRASR